jgi:hypothetical protein
MDSSMYDNMWKGLIFIGFIAGVVSFGAIVLLARLLAHVHIFWK